MAVSKQSPKHSRGNSCLTIFAVVLGLLAAVFYYLDQHLDRFYIFDTEHLHDLSRRAIAAHGNDTRAVVNYIVGELDQKFEGKYLNLEEEWVFNNAGGAMGAMYIIHASKQYHSYGALVFGIALIDYSRHYGVPDHFWCVAFFFSLLAKLNAVKVNNILGTAVGTEGHTGRHTADDFFYILKGAQLTYTPGSFEPDVYEQGSVNLMRRGDARQYKMESSCFALEYARGWIPPMLFFGYADALTSTLDIPTIWRTTYITAKQMIGNLLQGKM